MGCSRQVTRGVADEAYWFTGSRIPKNPAHFTSTHRWFYDDQFFDMTTSNVIKLEWFDKRGALTADEYNAMTAQRWLDLWEETFRSSLAACEGVPTVLFNMHEIIGDVDGSVATLKQRLEAAGVRGLHMPSAGEIQHQFRCAAASSRLRGPGAACVACMHSTHAPSALQQGPGSQGLHSGGAGTSGRARSGHRCQQQPWCRPARAALGGQCCRRRQWRHRWQRRQGGWRRHQGVESGWGRQRGCRR